MSLSVKALSTSLAVAFSCLATLGCGPGGPPRYEVNGTVTFRGAPIPSGRIVFEPDQAAGNQGPAAYAQISAGRYATPSGKGTVGGPHRVRILGFDGVAVGTEAPDGRMLFPDYATTVDLPPERATRDFDVPAPGG